MAECVLGLPIFVGSTMIAQLGEIMKVLGTPTHEQIVAMNKAYTRFNVRRCCVLVG